MKDRLGTLLVVANHVDIHHHENLFEVVDIAVEVIDDPVVLGAPHEPDCSSRTRQCSCCDETVEE